MSNAFILKTLATAKADAKIKADEARIAESEAGANLKSATKIREKTHQDWVDAKAAEAKARSALFMAADVTEDAEAQIVEAQTAEADLMEIIAKAEIADAAEAQDFGFLTETNKELSV